MKAHYLRRLPFIHPRSKPIRWGRFFIFLVVSIVLAYSTLLIILGAGNVISSLWFYILPPILAFIGLLLTLYPLVFPSSDGRESSISIEYGLQQVSQLNPSNYKLFRYIKHAYILRDADSIVRTILQDISAQNHHNKTLGICLFGKPAQGKTRLAWEAMQAELTNWTLVRWSHLAQVPFDFDAQEGKQIILWLDDLHEYANPNESVIINDLPRRFLEKGANLIIIATCRDGEDQLQATKYLGKLLEQLIPITLEDISTNEALNLSKILVQEGLELSSDEFDGTPGSLIFGLQRMTSRYLNLTPSSQIILKAMKLLHSARIHIYTEKSVKNVSHDVFGLDMKEWRKSYESLDRSDFIRVTVRNNELMIEPVAEIYLEKVIIDYPTPHSKLTDDWIALKESFQQNKNADGLNTLGLSAKWESLTPQQEAYQFSEECYHSALEIYLDEHDDVNWAGTLNNLGTLFSDQAELATRDQAINLVHKGIEAFNAALTVFSRENTPTYWIMVQCNLGTLLVTKSGLVNDEDRLILLNDAIQIFQNILNIEPQEWIANAEILTSLGIAFSHKAELVEHDVQNHYFERALQTFRKVLAIHDHDHNSFAWAKAQKNLGAALVLKANFANNQEEKHNLLDQAAQAHQAALTVYTKESEPLSWASTQFNLGSALSIDANLMSGEDRNKLLKEAIQAYHAALTISAKESTPTLWSTTQYHLGTVLNRQARLANGQEKLKQLDEAIQAYYAALEVYNNKANFPTEWSQVQYGIGQALYDKAILEDGQEESILLAESIQAFHKVLEVCTQEHNQSAWSSTQHSLGISLHRLSSHVSGKEEIQLLNQAIESYYNALKGVNKIDNSAQWGLIQLNLSIALGTLALVVDRQERQPLLDEGLTASRAALSVYSHENKPHNYAKAEQLLGTFLFYKDTPSDTASQIERIHAAMHAFRSALEIFTKENSVSDWAQTQYTLGNAITSLFDLIPENITYELVADAVKAYKSALEIFTPENNPNEWVGANIGLAVTYHVSSLHVMDKNIEVGLLREAHRILDSVLTIQNSNSPEEITMFAKMLFQRINDDLDIIENTQ